MTDITSLAFVGAVGGAGTTRTAVECAAALARGSRDVAVLDAAYGTQGLSEHVDGRIDPDVTALCLDPDRPLSEGLYDLDASTEGRVALAPARAPFERIARAKAVEPARELERRIGEAATRFDHVIVDTPPIAANQAVAAVHAVDRVALVRPATPHGADGGRRQLDALRDVDALDESPVVLAVGEREDPDDAPDVTVPRGPSSVAAAPACLGRDEFAAATVAAAESLFDAALGVEFESTGVVDRIASSVERVRGDGG